MEVHWHRSGVTSGSPLVFDLPRLKKRMDLFEKGNSHCRCHFGTPCLFEGN